MAQAAPALFVQFRGSAGLIGFDSLGWALLSYPLWMQWQGASVYSQAKFSGLFLDISGLFRIIPLKHALFCILRAFSGEIGLYRSNVLWAYQNALKRTLDTLESIRHFQSGFAVLVCSVTMCRISSILLCMGLVCGFRCNYTTMQRTPL